MCVKDLVIFGRSPDLAVVEGWEVVVTVEAMVEEGWEAAAYREFQLCLLRLFPPIIASNCYMQTDWLICSCF